MKPEDLRSWGDLRTTNQNLTRPPPPGGRKARLRPHHEPGPRTGDGQERVCGLGHGRTRVRRHAALRGEEEAAAGVDCVPQLQGYQGGSISSAFACTPPAGRGCGVFPLHASCLLSPVDTSPAPCNPGTTGTVQRDPPLQTLREFQRPHPALSDCCVHVPPGQPARACRLACNTNLLSMQQLAPTQQADALRAHGQIRRGNTCSDDVDPQVNALPSADVNEAPLAPLRCKRM